MWLNVAAEFRPARISQMVTPITGPVGWLRYLSKHAARGVAHYQRQGMPAGWEKSGRLWGHGGAWPVAEPIEGVLTDRQFWQVRRMVRNFAVAAVRARALAAERRGDWTLAAVEWRRLGRVRRLLSCNRRDLSAVRGVSDWVPGGVFLAFALCAGWDGLLRDGPALSGHETVKPAVDRGSVPFGLSA